MADLIDRAAAIEEMRRFKEIMGTNRCNAGWYDAVSIVKDLPAVDAVPVVYGRWEELDDPWGDVHYRCSVCGCEWFLEDGTPEDNGMNYCPKCGAKMDGEAHEHAETTAG